MLDFGLKIISACEYLLTSDHQQRIKKKNVFITSFFFFFPFFYCRLPFPPRNSAKAERANKSWTLRRGFFFHLVCLLIVFKIKICNALRKCCFFPSERTSEKKISLDILKRIKQTNKKQQNTSQRKRRYGHYWTIERNTHWHKYGVFSFLSFFLFFFFLFKFYKLYTNKAPNIKPHL